MELTTLIDKHYSLRYNTRLPLKPVTQSFI